MKTFSVRVSTKRQLVAMMLVIGSSPAQPTQDSPEYCSWQAHNLAIEAPLCGLVGDPLRGRALAADRHGGNCLACHALPIPEEPFHGTVGPPLQGIGSRYTAAQIRLRVVDEQQVNPLTIMPGFYRHPASLNRLADASWGKTLLTAQQVEDLVAYLATLR